MEINKYVLYSHGKDQSFFIDEIIEVNLSIIKLTNILVYNLITDNNFHYSNFKIITVSKKKYVNNIIYSSDNKSDVIEYLNTFIKTKKYNI